MAERLDRGLERVSTALATLGATLLGLLAVFVIIDIVGRQIGTPVRGMVELAAMGVASVAFLAIPYAMRRGGHIRSTIVVNRLPAAYRRGLDRLTYAIGAAVFAVIAWASWQPALSAYLTGAYEGEGALRVPTWPTRTIVLVASIVMVAECVSAFAKVGAEADNDG